MCSTALSPWGCASDSDVPPDAEGRRIVLLASAFRWSPRSLISIGLALELASVRETLFETETVLRVSQPTMEGFKANEPVRQKSTARADDVQQEPQRGGRCQPSGVSPGFATIAMDVSPERATDQSAFDRRSDLPPFQGWVV